MRRKIPVFWFCLVGTILLTVGVIFLPRYVSRSLDLRRMNHVEVSKREDFSFLKPGSNEVVEVSQAFRNLEQEGENPLLLATIDNPEQISTELLDAVSEQTTLACEYGILPWLGIEDGETVLGEYKVPVYRNWTDYVTSARSYSLTYASSEEPNKKEILNFWYLHFSDGEDFDYSFIVNAVTYQIYYAKIYNSYASHMAEAYQADKEGIVYEPNDGISTKAEGYNSYIGEVFSSGCASYYEAVGCNYVEQSAMNQKMGIAILYYEKEPNDTQNIYIERRIVSEPVSNYLGVSMGFQNLIRWADELL